MGKPSQLHHPAFAGEIFFTEPNATEAKDLQCPEHPCGVFSGRFYPEIQVLGVPRVPMESHRVSSYHEVPDTFIVEVS